MVVGVVHVVEAGSGEGSTVLMSGVDSSEVETVGLACGCDGGQTVVVHLCVRLCWFRESD